MPEDRWSDARLDELKTKGDDHADPIFKDRDVGLVARVLNRVARDGVMDLEGLDEGLRRDIEAFMAYSPDLEASWTDADRKRIRRAQRTYLAFGAPVVASLLLSAIPQGYCAPRLARVLRHTRVLLKATYKRLLGVLQMVLDVIFVGGFEVGGVAVKTGAKLRLMHAGIRHLLREHIKAGELVWGDDMGLVISREDMLATLMGFSLLVVDGLATLGTPLDPAFNEDVWFLWRNFGRTLGIPEKHLPTDVADARAFYAAYQRRNFKPAAQNPEGVELAAMNIEVVAKELRPWLPAPLARPGVAEDMCRSIAAHLIGHDCAEMLGVRRSDRLLLHAGLHLLRFGVAVPYFAYTRLIHRKSPLRRRTRKRAREINSLILVALIAKSLGGRPNWQVPSRLEELAKLVEHRDDAY